MGADNGQLRIAILSTAHLHADSYAHALGNNPNAVITTVWDDDTERGRQKATKYGSAFEPDLDKALSSCDAVIITSENAKHPELTLKAASAGRHVLCEKPLAISPADAVKMVRGCKDAGVLLGTAFPVRQAGSMFAIRDSISAGNMGDILMIRGTNRGMNPGRWFVQKNLSGGGALTDHTVHVADAIRFVTGEEIETVYAEMDTKFNPELEVEDCGLLMMTLSNGAFASLDPSWSRPVKAFPNWGDVTMQVTGTKGVATVDLQAAHTNVYLNSRGRGTWASWGENSDQFLVDDFVDAVREGRSPLASGEDGLRAVEVVDAAYRAVSSGQPAKVEHLQV